MEGDLSGYEVAVYSDRVRDLQRPLVLYLQRRSAEAICRGDLQKQSAETALGQIQNDSLGAALFLFQGRYCICRSQKHRNRYLQKQISAEPSPLELSQICTARAVLEHPQSGDSADLFLCFCDLQRQIAEHSLPHPPEKTKRCVWNRIYECFAEELSALCRTLSPCYTRYSLSAGPLHIFLQYFFPLPLMNSISSDLQGVGQP